MEEIKVIQEYPKYIELEKGYIIVDSKEEEYILINSVKEEKNERTSKDNSKGINKKKSNISRSIGTRGESE